MLYRGVMPDIINVSDDMVDILCICSILFEYVMEILLFIIALIASLILAELSLLFV